MLEPLATQARADERAAPNNREAVFLRADRLEGISQQWIEASGKAELRTRTQTVIADWLRYDVETDEMWGKGNVTIRRGIDWITGPEVKFNRHTDLGFFTSPEFHVGENASRGSATEILFNGPDRYEIKDASYTTCVAGNDDWYLRSADVDLDRSRVVGTARDATIYFKGAPILYCAVDGFSAYRTTASRGFSRRFSGRRRAAVSRCRSRTTSISRRTTTTRSPRAS